jgi:hypothetical protein
MTIYILNLVIKYNKIQHISDFVKNVTHNDTVSNYQLNLNFSMCQSWTLTNLNVQIKPKIKQNKDWHAFVEQILEKCILI